MPSIGFRRKIYVKKEFVPITRMYIEKLINFMKGEILPINSNHPIRSVNNNIEDNSLPTNIPKKYILKMKKRKIYFHQ